MCWEASPERFHAELQIEEGLNRRYQLAGGLIVAVIYWSK